MLNFGLENRVSFYIEFNDNIMSINEPLNFREIMSIKLKTKLQRNMNYHGIFPIISEAIQFVGNTAKYIINIYEEYGVNAEICLYENSKHPITDKWSTVKIGTFDLSSYVNDNYKKVTTQINSDGFLTIYKSRKSKNLEINRETTLDGDIISSINTKNLYLDGRKIFLVSQSKLLPKEIGEQIMTQGGTNYYMFTPKTEIVTKSDEMFHAVIAEPCGWDAEPNAFTVGNMFYGQADQDKTLNIDININIDFIVSDTQNYLSHRSMKLWVFLDKFTGGGEVEYEYSHTEELFYTDSYINDIINVIINKQINLDVLEGESIAIHFQLYCDDFDFTKFDYYKYTGVYNLTISEDSHYLGSSTKTILIHELSERLSLLIGADGFKSNFLGRKDIGYLENGEGSNIALAHGFWIRQFSDDDDKFKPLTISMESIYNSINTVYPIGMTIEKSGSKEYLRIENRDYFYQKFIGIKIGEVRNFTTKPFTEQYYSSVKVGFEKPSEDIMYEEAMGLDEFNTSTEFLTAIKTVVNELSIKSKLRADSYGVEFARRKNKSEYPTEDTKYDKDIFMFDIEFFNGDNIRLSKWEDDLDELPTGIYSPETAFNLMFSPARLIERHGKYIKVCLTKNLDSYLVYINSIGNSNMTTVKDGVSLTENKNIYVKNLDPSIYNAQEISFEYNVDYSFLEQLNGETNNIPNMYGLIEYIYMGKKMYGHIIEVNNNKFKIISNR